MQTAIVADTHELDIEDRIEARGYLKGAANSLHDIVLGISDFLQTGSSDLIRMKSTLVQNVVFPQEI